MEKQSSIIASTIVKANKSHSTTLLLTSFDWLHIIFA